jgi:tape measure domain-containing protein
VADATFSVRLQADGSGLVGTVRASRAEVDALRQALGRASNGADQLVDRFGRSFARVSQGAREATASISQMSASTLSLSRVESLLERIAGGVDRLNQSQRRLNQSSNQAASGIAGLTARLQALQNILTGFGAIAVTRQLSQPFVELTKSAVSFDRLNASMLAASNNATEAAIHMEVVQKTAKELGLDVENVAKGYVKLLSASKETALEGVKIQDVFINTSKAAAVLRLSTEQTNRIFLAFTQMISKGTIQSEELKRQLGDAFPGAVQIFARAMGVGTAELMKMMKTGQIFTDENLPKLAQGMADMVAPGVESATQSLGARLQRLSTSVKNAAWAIANSGFGAAVGGMAEWMSKAIDKAVELAKSINLIAPTTMREKITTQLGSAREEFLGFRSAITQLKMGASENDSDETIKSRAAAIADLSNKADAAAAKVKDLSYQLSQLGEKGAGVKEQPMDAAVETFRKQQKVIATAQEEAAEAADKANEKYQSLRSELEFQIKIIGMAEKEVSALTEVRKLDAKSTDAQKNKIASLARTLYDAKKAQENQKKALEESKKTADEANKKFAELEDTYSGLGEAEKAYLKSLKDIKEAHEKFGLPLERTNQYLAQATEQYLSASDSQEKWLADLRQETELLRLNGNEREVQIKLLEAHKLGMKDNDAEIRQLIEEQQRLRESAGKTNDSLLSTKNVARNAAYGIESAFSQAFQGMFDGTISKLSDFLGLFKTLIIRTISEIAAYWASSRLLQFLGLAGTSGTAAAGEGSSGGGGMFSNFGNMLNGVGNGALNEFGANYLGFAHGSDFVGPSQDTFFGDSTLGGTFAGAGMGFSLGQMGNNLAGGDSTMSQIGGAIGAIGGGVAAASFGLPPSVGAAAGSFIGSMIWGQFGGPPPNESTAGSLNLGTGNQNITTANAKTQQQFSGLMGLIQQWNNLITSASGAKSGVTVAVDVGTRDGIQVDLQGIGPEGPGSQVTFGKDDTEGAFKYVVKNTIDTFDGLSEAAKTLIKNFDGTSQQILDFTQTVLTINQQLPALQAVYGNQSLETLVKLSQLNGGMDQFNAGTNALIQVTGGNEAVTQANLKAAKTEMHTDLKALGTTRATFSQDYANAKAGTLTPEELKAWQDAAIAILKVQGLEQDLANERGEIVDSEENRKKGLQALGDTLNNLAKIRDGQNTSLMDQFRQQTATVRNLMAATDGSAQSLANLNTGLTDLGTIAQNVLSQVAAARASITSSGQAEVEGYKLQGMSPAQQYAYWQSKINEDYSDLSDPDAIAARHQTNIKARANMNQLLPEDQRSARANDFAEDAQKDQDAANKRNNEIGDEAKGTLSDIGDTITTKFGDALKPFLDANTDFKGYVNSFGNWVKALPDNVNATVVFPTAPPPPIPQNTLTGH